MENKEINTVIRTIGILGIIFCIVSLLTPWSSSGFTFGIFKENYSTPFYIDIFTNQTIRGSSYYTQAVFFSTAMIIIFVFTLSALILGLMCIGKVEEEIPSTFLYISALLIVNIILYITAVSLWSTSSVYVGLAYGSGFITALISFIIFFILFIFKSVFHKEIKPIEKMKPENEAINILKTRYAKGEITKEQFVQMFKELE